MRIWKVLETTVIVSELLIRAYLLEGVSMLDISINLPSVAYSVDVVLVIVSAL